MTKQCSKHKIPLSYPYLDFPFCRKCEREQIDHLEEIGELSKREFDDLLEFREQCDYHKMNGGNCAYNDLYNCTMSP